MIENMRHMLMLFIYHTYILYRDIHTCRATREEMIHTIGGEYIRLIYTHIEKRSMRAQRHAMQKKMKMPGKC